MCEKICSNRNCEKCLDGMRKHAQYCCRNCKDMEGFYKRRDIKKLPYNPISGCESKGTLKSFDIEIDGIIYTFIADSKDEIITSLYKQILELESEIERMKD